MLPGVSVISNYKQFENLFLCFSFSKVGITSGNVHLDV